MLSLKSNKFRLAIIRIIKVCSVVAIISLSFLFYSERQKNIAINTDVKVIVVGLDGATWDIILPLVKQHKMPNVARMMKQGSFGILKSLEPMESPIVWTSIATGKLPEKHGIGTEAFSYLQDSTSIKTNTVWDILEKNGKKIGLFDWLVTWPPRKINGFIIPGWTAQDEETYPKDIFQNVPLEIAQHELGSLHGTFNMLNQLSVKFFYLRERFNPDFYAIVFYGTDELQHVFWKYMQPQLFKDVPQEEIKKFGSVIYRYYEDFDKFLGKLLKVIDKDTVILIVSDHGFGPNTENDKGPFYFFDMKRLLFAIGLQKFDKSSGNINVAESIVYAGRNMYKNQSRVFINTKAKDVSYLITGHEYNKVKNQVIKLLEDIKIEGSNRSILRFKKMDERGGLIFEILYQNFSEEGYIRVADKDFLLKDFIMKGGFCGVHRAEGVVILFGKRRIRQGKKLQNASLLDITPTILYLFGLPVGKDMDGKVLTEAVRKDCLRYRPIKYIPSYDAILSNNVIRQPETNNIENINENLIKKLKSLGYLQ